MNKASDEIARRLVIALRLGDQSFLHYPVTAERLADGLFDHPLLHPTGHHIDYRALNCYHGQALPRHDFVGSQRTHVQTDACSAQGRALQDGDVNFSRHDID